MHMYVFMLRLLKSRHIFLLNTKVFSVHGLLMIITCLIFDQEIGWRLHLYRLIFYLNPGFICSPFKILNETKTLLLSLLSRCNLAPLSEFAEDVGMSSDFITMNPSVIQRAYGGFKNESDREKFVQRLAMLNGSVLWIPAFMVKGGEKHVEWVNELILKNKLKVRTAYPSLRLVHAVRG